MQHIMAGHLGCHLRAGIGRLIQKIRKKSEPRQAVRFVLARFSTYKSMTRKPAVLTVGGRSIFPENIALFIRYIDLFRIAVANILQFPEIRIVEAVLREFPGLFHGLCLNIGIIATFNFVTDTICFLPLFFLSFLCKTFTNFFLLDKGHFRPIGIFFRHL